MLEARLLVLVRNVRFAPGVWSGRRLGRWRTLLELGLAPSVLGDRGVHRDRHVPDTDSWIGYISMAVRIPTSALGLILTWRLILMSLKLLEHCCRSCIMSLWVGRCIALTKRKLSDLRQPV